ncbi:type I-B CRISPR-associated protein Cas7/Csh2 [Halobaculum sp. MBLA0143]|uniref:type I-B CRISPR-associated protein Cas7/Csh2 n=1 Tax=Halobaculum sp. MBLA0143 TaxID=3079933 RepID=UPI0035240ECE
MSDTDYTPPENRSEIVLLYDARDCNPNGDPLSSDNRPRIDPATDQAIVTDVRLKRYIRDQLYADGEPILIQNSSQLGEKPTRERLYDEVATRMDEGIDPERAFLEAATDVRYFGATISVNSDVTEDLPTQFVGPVQFQTGRSYNPVEVNEATQRLTTVIYSSDDAEQGTFATDQRLQYALVGFTGVVNENAATDTRLTQSDVERLDTLVWRALSNQTMTRSKVGQQPRLYLRVEYVRDDFHIGNLDETFDMSTEGPLADVRTIKDYAVDISGFVEQLSNHSEAIETVHVEEDRRMSVTGGDGETYESVGSAIESVSGISVAPIGVYQDVETAEE